jgi:putative ATPase
MDVPLAEKLRPERLDDFAGQEHLVGMEKPLRVAMEKKHVFSFILWGPPGVGKTTLARLYAKAIEREVVEISAVSAGKDDMRKAAEKGGVLFVDEIHRFNKAQQDFLLPFVEKGQLVLIGATTENPSFEVISPLLSRCRVFVLKELTINDLDSIKQKIEKELDIKISKSDFEYTANLANGDARQLINLIEVTYQLYGKINEENINQAMQSKHLRYDKLGEEHFNTISAFIKSMRASDVDAALYYLARMVEAGEDPLFIARRMVVFASEDVNSPTALVVANAVFRACETVGFPECQENLAAGAVYLAQAPKDRRSYDAYMAALADVKALGNLPIPLEVRNAPTKLMKDLNYSKGYEMYSKKGFLPEKLKNKIYFKK